jgi:hypothetical protein
MKPSKPSTSSAASTTDKRTTPERSSAGSADSAQREGPASLPDKLDRTGGWNDAAAHPGYQKNDQGGYRGGYSIASDSGGNKNK